jgi:GGDEF domain-containing protein
MGEGAPIPSNEAERLKTVTRAPMSDLDRGMLNDFAERVMMRIRNMRARNFVDQPTGLFNRLRFEEDIHQTNRVNSACEIDAVDVITPKVLNDIVKAPGYICAQDVILTITSRLQKCYPIIACFIKSVRRDSA